MKIGRQRYWKKLETSPHLKIKPTQMKMKRKMKWLLTAISYQDDLRDFALSRQSPGLVELISKSRTAIEKLMCNPDRLKQTKLSDFFTMVPTCLYVRTCSPQLLPFIVV